MEVMVEDIVDFGRAVEVEIICAPGAEAESKEKIEDLFITDLDISDSDILPKSVTNIIVKTRSFFTQEVIF